MSQSFCRVGSILVFTEGFQLWNLTWKLEALERCIFSNKLRSHSQVSGLWFLCRETNRIVHQMVDGIDYCHKKNVIHRGESFALIVSCHAEYSAWRLYIVEVVRNAATVEMLMLCRHVQEVIFDWQNDVKGHDLMRVLHFKDYLSNALGENMVDVFGELKGRTKSRTYFWSPPLLPQMFARRYLARAPFP